MILFADKKNLGAVDMEDFLECMKQGGLFNDDEVSVDEVINEMNMVKQEEQAKLMQN